MSLAGCNVMSPEADFAAEPTEVIGLKKVPFTRLSRGTVRSWAWDFESDGIIDSTEQNPAFTYSINGTITVTLTVTGLVSDSSITREHYIIVSGCSG